ncbi:hypothetical protein ACTPEM_25850, partial [Clostridioides difficile]
LISSRIFQAVGASILMATGLGIVSNAFPANEKGKAIGITGAVLTTNQYYIFVEEESSIKEFYRELDLAEN